jgi:hypothetical protein
MSLKYIKGRCGMTLQTEGIEASQSFLVVITKLCNSKEG